MSAPVEDSPSLVDTNILIYAYGHDEPLKHAVALRLLEQLASRDLLVFSSQVFNEFCSVMMRPSRPGRLEPDRISLILGELKSIGEVLPVTSEITFRGLGAMQSHGLSFWDALIWAAAAENHISVLYTEDYQHGRVIEGVRFINPFLPDEPQIP